MQRNLQEIIVSAAGPSSAGQGAGTITLYDLATGTAIFTQKQSLAGPKCSVATLTRHGQGGLMLAAQSDKSLLNVYTYQKDQLHLRIVLPEKLTCIAVDPGAEYCAGGSQNGRIYLWEIASGIMFNSWEAHYRRISAVKFTPDSAALVTGSDDSSVSVWTMASLLDNSTPNDIPNAYYTMNDHTLPITDIICGIGHFPLCRILTSSLDNSCKLTDLSSRSLVSTFQLPRPITSLAMDPTERAFFAASPDGYIHQVNLFRRRNDAHGHTSFEAVGGGGQGSAEMIAFDDAEKERLLSVGHPINCMAISLTGSNLVVGTSAAKIQIFDIASHQLIRSITAPKDFSVNSLQVMLKPQDLLGHSTLSDVSSKTNDTLPVQSVVAFQRTRDPKTRGTHEVLILPPSHPNSFIPIAHGPSMEDLLDDHRFFINQSLSSSTAQVTAVEAISALSTVPGITSATRIAELERELASARSQLTRAKELNNSIWESAVASIAGDAKKSKPTSGTATPGSSTREIAAKSPAPVNGVEATTGRPQKRGRVG